MHLFLPSPFFPNYFSRLSPSKDETLRIWPKQQEPRIFFIHFVKKRRNVYFYCTKTKLLGASTQQVRFSRNKSILTNVCTSIFPQIFRSSTKWLYWTHRRIVIKSLKKSTTWWTSGKRVFLSKIVSWEILSTQWKRWVSEILSIKGKKKPKEFAVSSTLIVQRRVWKWTHFSQTQKRPIYTESQIFSRMHSPPKVLCCHFLYFCYRVKTFGLDIERWIWVNR